MKWLLGILIVVSTVKNIDGQDVFSNPQYGFSIEKPENWLQAPNEALIKNLEKLDITDEELGKIIRTSLIFSALFLICSKKLSKFCAAFGRTMTFTVGIKPARVFGSYL